MIDTWLTTPARLLYWSFFKPLTLRAYQRQFGVKLDSNGDFSLLSVRRQLRTNPALRRYVAQMGVALLLGLLPLFPLSVLAEMIRVAVTPDAVFNWAYVAGGVAFGVAVGVAVGVAGGVAVGVAFGVAVGVAGGVAFGVA
ncbi:MAG TPA: hypothetical protein PLD25_22200, partial [Chloroflexota bacterium]|nr:hypothetical protein [Chloroflexota bacterium]